MARLVTRCIFCGRQDLSREHVWPTWSHEYVRRPDNPKQYIRRRLTTSSRTHVSKETGSETKHGDVTTTKLKVVCERHCNNGWMSRLETRVKPILVPMLTGNRVLMSKYNQEIVATWIAMKMMTAEFSVPDDIVTPAIERTLVMGRRLPSEMMAIWIGRYQGKGWHNAYLRHAASIGFAPAGTIPIAPKGSVPKTVQAQTFFIGELFVQVVTTTVRQLIFQTPPAFAPIIRQIWPFQYEFSWPPTASLFDFHASIIFDSFGRYLRQLPIAPGAASE